MESIKRYFSNLFLGFYSLWQGLMLTLYYFTHPKKTIITQQYPENRESLVIPMRYAGNLEMPHDENNEHKCTACTLCEQACPNGTISIVTKSIETPEGKTKKALDTYTFNLGLCTFCQQCVDACPFDAITMVNEFELSVYDRSQLIHQLNAEGSKLKEKEKKA
ncbi:MAG: NuoI/complex I 23 kDa subunit family protein [Bacteroidales bacterium]